MTSSKGIHPKNLSIATFTAFALIPLSGMVTDIYLPSMPNMALDLGVAEHKVQLTLTYFLISYGLSQFLAGSLLDAYGRRKITLASLVIFIAASLAIAFSKSINLIIFLRALQGVSVGFILVSKRAFFVDVFEGEKRKGYLSIMTIVWSSAPIIAPFLGGYLESFFSWQSNFYVLAGYGFIMLLLELFFSGETLNEKHPFRLRSVAQRTSEMLTAPDYAIGIIILGFAYGMIMMFSMAAPFIIEHKMGYSPVTTGYAALLMGLAWMSGGFLGKALIHHRFVLKLMRAGLVQIIAATLMVLISYYITTLYTLLPFSFVLHLLAGFLFNTYFAYCLGRFPQYAGLSNGLTGGSVYIVTSILTFIMIKVLKLDTQMLLSVGYVIFASGIVISLIALRAVNKRKMFWSRTERS